MKRKFFLPILLLIFTSVTAFAQQDKSKRPSPPAKLSETIASGVTVTIDYSQPSLKGRTVGKDVAPYGKVWRTGANEATVFEINKDATVEGKRLPAGRYGLFSIPGENSWVIIFSKKADVWGTQYSEGQDALRVTVKPERASTPTERMTFRIAKSGVVSLLWGDQRVNFQVK